MKASVWIIIGVVILLGFVLVGTFKTGSVVKDVVKEEVFEGTITNLNLEPSTLEGTGVYDRSCNPVENGLTQCDAGIQTEKGLLNFNYKHQMHSQPCIDQGDKLTVEVLENGKARVTRK